MRTTEIDVGRGCYRANIFGPQFLIDITNKPTVAWNGVDRLTENHPPSLLFRREIFFCPFSNQPHPLFPTIKMPILMKISFSAAS